MIFIAGCAPYMTYHEMEDAHEIAETQEEKDVLRKKIDKFEMDAENARLYFDRKNACKVGTEVTWYCDNVLSVEERKIRSLDGLVRAYRREHKECGCVKIQRLMDALHRNY